MIQTETNTHLFIHEDNMRQLLTYKMGSLLQVNLKIVTQKKNY